MPERIGHTPYINVGVRPQLDGRFKERYGCRVLVSVVAGNSEILICCRRWTQLQGDFEALAGSRHIAGVQESDTRVRVTGNLARPELDDANELFARCL